MQKRSTNYLDERTATILDLYPPGNSSTLPTHNPPTHTLPHACKYLHHQVSLPPYRVTPLTYTASGPSSLICCRLLVCASLHMMCSTGGRSLMANAPTFNMWGPSCDLAAWRGMDPLLVLTGADWRARWGPKPDLEFLRPGVYSSAKGGTLSTCCDR